MDRMQGADRHSQASTTTLLSIAAVVVAATVGIIAFVNSNRTASTPFDATRNFYAPSVQIPPGLPRQ
jgi:flagellar basal body-associated protein FliL